MDAGTVYIGTWQDGKMHGTGELKFTQFSNAN